MNVLSFVNGGTSTSYPIELAARIDADTDADVTIASFYDETIDDADPDVAALDIDYRPLDASSRMDPSAYRRLRSLLDDADILHTHYNTVGSLGRLASIGEDVAMVNTEHNDHRHFTHLQNAVNALTYPLTDMMIFNSYNTLKTVRAYERPLRLGTEHVVYNGIDFERVDEGIGRSDLSPLPSGLRIVTACRIDEQKNIPTLVESMRHVLAEVPEAELIVVGDGPKRPAAEATAARLGLEDSVTFLGYLPEREQVYGVLARCDVFAVPSIYEGFCNAAVEAMGCGLPVVASDIDVLREVVAESGRFADPRDAAAFSEPLISLLRDDSVRANLAQTARARARTTFPIERTIANYYEVYDRVLTNNT